MLRSYRGIVATLVGLAWIFSFYFIVDDLGSVSRQAEANASDRAEEYRQDAERYVERRCLRLAVPAAEDCAREAYQAARENQRIEQDLAAQRMMAWWTQIMGVAALMAMAISTVGVWLVWTTFRETKRTADAAFNANDIARHGMKEQLRPYLYPARGWFEMSEHLPTALVEIKNFGQSPALETESWIHIWVECFPLHDPLPAAPPHFQKAKCVIGPGGSTEVMHPRPNPLNEQSRAEIEAGRAALYVYGRIEYRDIFGQHHWSEYTYFASGSGSLKRGRLASYMSGNAIGTYPANDDNRQRAEG